MDEQINFDLNVPEETRKCKNCDYILAVKFKEVNLFFCTATKGGTHGKKITKNKTICPMYKKAEYDLIPRMEGYFGQELGGIER